MFKRIILALAASFSTASALPEPSHVTIGTVTVVMPSGWKQVKKDEERIILRPADTHQQATLSVMNFGADASFEDFKKLCSHRIAAEKKELTDGFVESQPPFESEGKFGMFFSGGDKKTRRVFSGYLILKKRELVTIYVEGVGIAPKDHLDSFKKFVSGLTQQ